MQSKTNRDNHKTHTSTRTDTCLREIHTSKEIKNQCLQPCELARLARSSALRKLSVAVELNDRRGGPSSPTNSMGSSAAAAVAVTRAVLGKAEGDVTDGSVARGFSM